MGVGVGGGWGCQQYTGIVAVTQSLFLKRQSSARHILSQQLLLLETGFNWTFISLSQIFMLVLSSFSRPYLCLFVRISSMILQLLTSKRSMEKQESQFIDGTKFNKKDAFRES